MEYMFNLFPKKKSVNKILEDANLQPLSFTWTLIPDDNSKKDAYIKNLRDQQECLYKENTKLKLEIEKWEKDWDDQNKVIRELNERVNEIDNDVIRDLQDEILVRKNDYAVLRAKHQVIQNDYKKCTEQRDEYKHQLNVANKEIEALKIKHPMYPIHWGGVSNLVNSDGNEVTWEEAASDLALRVTKLEEQLKYIQKISFTE